MATHARASFFAVVLAACHGGEPAGAAAPSGPAEGAGAAAPSGAAEGAHTAAPSGPAEGAGAAVPSGLEEVARATTAAEERAAFAALVRGEGVAFTAHDAEGKQLDMGVYKWWEQARTLRLGLRRGGPKVEHTLIDPANVPVLMQE